MSRIPVAGLALALVLSATPAAPVPTHLMPKDLPLYYPTQVGTRMVWQKEGFECAVVVTRVEERDGAKIVSVSTEGPDGVPVPHMKLSVSRRGVFQIANGRGEATDPPFCLLTGAGDPGSKWETDNGVYASVHTVCRAEWVEVPAGRFWAVRVESEYRAKGGGETTKKTRWFAVGVGEVKSAYWGLKSFTPGKK